DRLTQLEELEKRREAIIKSLKDQEKFTDELKIKIEQAETMAVLEDIYLPFRPKRRTRATIAREKGLEPLAEKLFAQEEMDPISEAAAFIDEEKGVETAEDALSGARDIIAEWINEDQETRAGMRSYFAEKSIFISKVLPDKETEAAKYRDYFEWQEPVAKAPSHRILAMRRGEKEGFLNLRVDPRDEDEAYALLEARFVKGDLPSSEQVKISTHDCYKRLLSHSMETEIRLETKKRADNEAIRVFGDNIRELLLSSPLGQKCVMAIDPGFRTGCKLVCLDPQGKLLHFDTIYPLLSQKQKSESENKVLELCKKFHTEAIAIGNGTGGRETEAFITALALPENVQVVMVNESGASIYSASAAAREEFPDQDVTVRGAVSIGRRLMDPLAELVKIDPKSIG
ncbi:MAG: RNA-binding transcriptional accessory protein, partial [bacterium]|nr:RNA-binding transcriptional accessory protein [bacterium]